MTLYCGRCTYICKTQEALNIHWDSCHSQELLERWIRVAEVEGLQALPERGFLYVREEGGFYAKTEEGWKRVEIR